MARLMVLLVRDADVRASLKNLFFRECPGFFSARLLQRYDLASLGELAAAGVGNLLFIPENSAQMRELLMHCAEFGDNGVRLELRIFELAHGLRVRCLIDAQTFFRD